MPGRERAVKGGAALANRVAKLGEQLGLEVKTNFRVGRGSGEPNGGSMWF